MTRITGLEHLTMLDVAPPEFVTAAAQAGFDAVGLRVAPLDPGGPAWPVAPGSPMLAETMRRCDQTGVAVLDVEAVPLRPGADLAGCEAQRVNDRRLPHGGVVGVEPVLEPVVDRVCRHVRQIMLDHHIVPAQMIDEQ